MTDRTSYRWTQLSPYLLLCMCGLFSYWNSLHAAFQFDDYAVIVNNPSVHNLAAWWDSMPGIRPLLKLSYTFNWVIDPDPLGFHLINLLSHLANGVMVMLIIKQWKNCPNWVAWSVAAIFVLHPVNTESVTYVSGRSVSLMAVFYLATFLAFQMQTNYWKKIASPLFFLLALCTKETAWTLPFALLLWEVTAKQQSWKTGISHLWPHWLVLFGGLSMMFGLETYRYLVTFSLESRPWGENILTQLHGQYYLVTQLFWPRPNIDPDIQAVKQITPVICGEIALLLSFVVLGFSSFKTRPWLAFGILWFFLHLLPTNSLLPRLDVANDRQLYIACIGPIFVIAYGMWHYFSRRALMYSLLTILLLFSGLTILRNAKYHDEISLWQATTIHSPDKPRVWLNMGYAYRLAGEKDQAIKAYEHALLLDPNYQQARINLKILKSE